MGSDGISSWSLLIFLLFLNIHHHPSLRSRTAQDGESFLLNRIMFDLTSLLFWKHFFLWCCFIYHADHCKCKSNADIFIVFWLFDLRVCSALYNCWVGILSFTLPFVLLFLFFLFFFFFCLLFKFCLALVRESWSICLSCICSFI